MFCIYNYFLSILYSSTNYEKFLPLLAFYITLLNTCFYHGLRMVEMTEIYLLNFNIVVYFNVQNRLMLLSNCAVCSKKKSTFIKNLELSND